MRRNVDPDFEFNKDRFADVLKCAIGDRSYSAFAKDSDLSFGYISKYMNKKSDVAPTIQTIKKMAKVAHVTYADLLNAAGYDETKHEENEISLAATQANHVWSPMNALFPTLYQANFDWKFRNTTNGSPLSVEVKGAPFGTWYFVPVFKEFVTKEDVINILGCKEAEIISPGSKVTFLTSNRDIFNEIQDMEFSLFSLYISCGLVNVQNGLISRESYLKTALEIPKEAMEYLAIADKNSLCPLSL